MIPKRKKPQKLGVRETPQIRCSGHRRWIRGFECTVVSQTCEGKIEAAHVRTGTDGGMGLKPGDNWVIPLCARHHNLQHAMGEMTFEQRYKIDMRAIAKRLWDMSPHRRRYEEPR